MMTDSFPNEVAIKATQVRVLLDYAQTNDRGVTDDQHNRFHQARQQPDEYEKLDILFNELSHLVHPVTIYTLHASDDYAADLLDPLYNYENKNTPSPRQKTRKLLTFTTRITSLLLFLIIFRVVFNHILDMFYISPETIPMNTFHTFLLVIQPSLNQLVPFTYGALGACAYVMIDGNNFIWNKQFDAHLITKDKMRILIGALSGVVGILLFKPLFGDPTPPNQIINFGEAGVAFIAGYSTDFLFERLNRIISAIVPRTQGVTEKLKMPSTPPDSTIEHRKIDEEKVQPKNLLVVEKHKDPIKAPSSLQGEKMGIP